MATFIGRVFHEAAKPSKGATGKGRPTKADLVAEAESLGIEVPSKATNPQIAELIEQAKGA